MVREIWIERTHNLNYQRLFYNNFFFHAHKIILDESFPCVITTLFDTEKVN